MPDLGSKHECEACGTKYYDLGKSNPACPKCGTYLDGSDPDEVDAASDASEDDEAALAELKEELDAAGEDLDDSEE